MRATNHVITTIISVADTKKVLYALVVTTLFFFASQACFSYYSSTRGGGEQQLLSISKAGKQDKGKIGNRKIQSF